MRVEDSRPGPVSPLLYHTVFMVSLSSRETTSGIVQQSRCPHLAAVRWDNSNFHGALILLTQRPQTGISFCIASMDWNGVGAPCLCYNSGIRAKATILLFSITNAYDAGRSSINKTMLPYQEQDSSKCRESWTERRIMKI